MLVARRPRNRAEVVALLRLPPLEDVAAIRALGFRKLDLDSNGRLSAEFLEPVPIDTVETRFNAVLRSHAPPGLQAAPSPVLEYTLTSERYPDDPIYFVFLKEFSRESNARYVRQVSILRMIRVGDGVDAAHSAKPPTWWGRWLQCFKRRSSLR